MADPVKLSPPPSASSSATATMTPGDLEATIATAVIQAVNIREERERAGKAALAQDLEERFELRIKRLKLIAGGLAAVMAIGGVIGGVFKWYGEREVEVVLEDQRRAHVDAAVNTITSRHTDDQVANVTAHDDLSTDIDELGALQLEQGADTRRILLEAVPKGRRAALEEKPKSLKDAEAKVRRQ